MTTGIRLTPPRARGTGGRVALGILLAALTGLGIVAIVMVRSLSVTAGGIGAANQFWSGLKNKNWQSVYALLPVEGRTFRQDGVIVTIPTQVTEEQFARNMSASGLGTLGPDYTVRYRILGARRVDASTVSVTVNYSVGGKERGAVYNIDFSKPIGVGSYAGTRPVRNMSNTEEIYFNLVDSKWKLDLGRANGFGFSIYGNAR